MRYSDKRLSEDFSIYVLFSDHLQGGIKEVLDAVAEDYKGVDWSSHQMGPDQIDTRGVTLSTDFGLLEDFGADAARGKTSFIGMPGRCQIDWDPVLQASRLINPDGRLAVERHTDHLQISVGSPKGDTSLAARFDAARRVTCIGAVLAKLPITLGVYFPNADLLVPPDQWVKAADTAMKGEIPVLQWMSIYTNFFEWDGPEPKPVTAGTIGLAAFNGHELLMPQARVTGPEAGKWMYGAVRMMLEAGHEFGDGNTMGVEGEGKPIRIRHVKEGGLDGQAQTDTWVFFHETSLLDDEKLLGERELAPPPPGFNNEVRGNWDTLKNQLYSFVAGGKG